MICLRTANTFAIIYAVVFARSKLFVLSQHVKQSEQHIRVHLHMWRGERPFSVQGVLLLACAWPLVSERDECTHTRTHTTNALSDITGCRSPSTPSVYDVFIESGTFTRARFTWWLCVRTFRHRWLLCLGGIIKPLFVPLSAVCLRFVYLRS